VATCLASTAVLGRPNRFPFDWASRSAASPALPRHPEPNPASGRNTHRWDDVLRPRMLLGLRKAGVPSSCSGQRGL
jgi:hypothetical protein